MTDLARMQPTMIVPTPDPTVTYLDPTGGRLVAWAEAASAANTLARALAQTTFVPKEMTNVGNATAAILMGDELGLSPLAALRSIYVVHGTPAMYARAMVALALSHGHEVWTEETSDTKVVVCGRRRGSDKVERAEWTMSRATKAGYTGNKKYATNPQEMLYSKAAAEITRKVAPDVLAGIPYSVEDLELEQPVTQTVTRESATAKRTVKRAERPAPTEPEIPATEPPAAPAPAEDIQDAEVVEPAAPTITPAQSKHLHTLVTTLGFTRDQKLAGLSRIAGREITSSKDLTETEAAWAIDGLAAKVAALDVEGATS